jgi:hypothetical protein
MNWSQVAGIVRIAGPALVGVLAQTGIISDSLATNLSAFIVTVVGSAAWSAYSNTNLNLSKAVAAVPGIQVSVSERAPPELQQAAADRNVPDIVPATPAFTPAPKGYRS